MKIRIPFLIAVAAGLISCKQQSQISHSETSVQSEAPVQTEAHKLLRETIDAHGGIEKWRSNGLLQFRWVYNMTDVGKVADSIQTVDPISFNVKHEVPNTDTQFGIYEEKAWISPADATFFPPSQFWSLTPIYFLGVPFVFDDTSAIPEILPEQKEFEGKSYQQLKITYDSSAGDSPDDYYVLLIDPTTKITRGVYYIVTSPIVTKGAASPEKFITLDDLKEVNGLMLSSEHKSYKMSDGKIGGQVRSTDVSQVKFVPRTEFDFSIPAEAKILDAIK